MSDSKILVTGATGKLGQKVVSSLLNDFNIAPEQLIVTTRSVSKLNELCKLGVEVREADFSNPESLTKAFKGADRLLLISIDASGPRTQSHLNAITAAEKAGVSHISYTSMPAAEESPVVFAHEHEATEAAIKLSNIPNVAILRNNWYFENLPEYFASVLQTGFWLTSSGEGKIAEVSREDLAYAAAASLVKDIKGKKTFNLNGTEALTHEEMALQINTTLGTSIQVVQLSDEVYKAKLESFELPKPIVDLCVTMDKHNRLDLSAGNGQDFESLTGRKPISFKTWLNSNKSQLLKLAE
ncbi:NAD(P)H-binding protein [Vibrio astriarenae]|uniref:NAD(P)H-binding protein n=1 Tax=Vibrio astriarenae TaxID=1481923 RepID=A0A7Z2T796_9VIBR|nr:SDR family oxidoreductase [Vibrio astriarenae]QIA65512.1 NAD(P)H-binding protein [Vibrio astriarenae]